MTVVGDVAQTGDLSGTSSWGSVFGRYVAQRWRLTELTVNYRTPAEVMALAATVLASIDPKLRPPTSVRSTGEEPRVVVAASSAGLGAALGDVVGEELKDLGAGRLGVIVPASRLAEFASAVRSVAPEAAVGALPDLTSTVVVLTVTQAKGLEFDTVVVADPTGIESGSPRGRSDLYVALTRATQRLTLVTDGPFAASTRLG
jgi:DNA helicase IV